MRARKVRGEKLIEELPGKYFRKEYIDQKVYPVLCKKANLRMGNDGILQIKKSGMGEEE